MIGFGPTGVNPSAVFNPGPAVKVPAPEGQVGNPEGIGFQSGGAAKLIGSDRS